MRNDNLVKRLERLSRRYRLRLHHYRVPIADYSRALREGVGGGWCLAPRDSRVADAAWVRAPLVGGEAGLRRLLREGSRRGNPPLLLESSEWVPPLPPVSSGYHAGVARLYGSPVSLLGSRQCVGPGSSMGSLYLLLPRGEPGVVDAIVAYREWWEDEPKVEDLLEGVESLLEGGAPRVVVFSDSWLLRVAEPVRGVYWHSLSWEAARLLYGLGYRVRLALEPLGVRSYWPLGSTGGEGLLWRLPYSGAYAFTLYHGSVPVVLESGRSSIDHVAESIFNEIISGLQGGTIASRYAAVVLSDLGGEGAVPALLAFASAGGLGYLYTSGLECGPLPWFLADRHCRSIVGDYRLIGSGGVVGEGVSGAGASMLVGLGVSSMLGSGARRLGFESIVL